MEKKKILIADTFETIGGEEKVAFNIYKFLNRNKFDVRITGTERSKYFDVYEPDKGELVNFFVKGKFSFIKMFKFRQLVKREKFDIINVHGYSAGFFVRLACAGLKNVRIIWTMHLKMTDIFNENNIKIFIENVMNNNLFFTNDIVTVCEDAANNLKHRKNKKTPMHVIYNGIDTNYYSKIEKNKNSDSLVLGFFSRLSVQKDVSLLLKTMNEFQKENKKIKLIIAGDGELKEQMLRFIQIHGLKNVEYIGFQKDVAQLFSKIDVCVLPTHTECMPMILLESLSSGTPVISSDVGGVSEIIENGKDGFVVPKESLRAFKEAIFRYYDHPSLIITHGKIGKKRMEDSFDQKLMVKNYEELFNGENK